MNVLGVRVDNLSQEEIFEKTKIFLSENRFHQIATINPEFILEAQKNDEFKNILNNCDLNIADGFGIKYAFWRFGKNLKSRMAGADLMGEILKIASVNSLKIFLVANSRGLSTWEETRDAIKRLYPDLEIYGINLEKELTGYQIRDTKYQILFCNFGAPDQEKFINAVKNDNIRLALGVGGSFDYLTGKIKRAPVFLRKLGLEWLWRLTRQPWRIKRIIHAIIIFPVKIIFEKENE